MCFSAGASFGAGVILSTIGVASLKQAKTSAQLPFAAIPLIFAVQQITEGFLWLALKEPVNASLQINTTHLFLFFAQVIWPVWVPFSIYRIEDSPAHKKRLKLLLLVGILVSAYLLYCLVIYEVAGQIIGYHISYHQDYPATFSVYTGTLYVLSTIAPPFLSSIKGMNYLGLAIFVSCIITAIFYEGYIISVWCFFASIISIAVYAILRGIRSSTIKVPDPKPF